jgi:hypothetical protein
MTCQLGHGRAVDPHVEHALGEGSQLVLQDGLPGF